MQLSNFSFEDHSVRIQLDDLQQPWFNAKDVCSALGYYNYRQAIEDHVDLLHVSKRDTKTSQGHKRVANFINEAGLYSLILGSHMPAAKRFKLWVTSEVLPSIRKTGSYSVVQTNPAPVPSQHLVVPDFSDPAAAARAWADQYEARKLAEQSSLKAKAETTALQVQLDRSHLYATIKRVQKLRPAEYDWRVLKRVAVETGVPPVPVFDQNYGTVNSYHASVWLDAYGVEIFPGASVEALDDLDRVYENQQG
jgi:prophage antirepressor-like protein